MSINHKLFAVVTIVVLVAGVLFAVGQKTFRHLSGFKGILHPQNSDTIIQRSQTSQPGAPAEIIGRMGYPLYR